MDVESALAMLISVAPECGLVVSSQGGLIFDELDEKEKLMFSCQLLLDEGELMTEYGQRLLHWSQRWNTQPAFEVMVSWSPSDCPARPPQVRLLRPILEHGTGGVLNGCFVGIPAIFPRGWDPHVGLPQVMSWVRECLRNKNARPCMDTAAFYNVQAYRSSERLVMRTAALPAQHTHRSGFKQTYTAFSSAWAQLVMQCNVPEGFDSGNKILLPSSALELLVRSELKDMGNGTGRTGGGRGAGAGGRDQDPLSLLSLSGTDGSSSMSESAMIFELFGPLGYPLYTGVKEFTAPEPGVIIVPGNMMAEAGLREGSRVELTRVILPAMSSVVLQPFSSNFMAVEELTTTGLPPKEFLEASLTSYACLQAGTTILCDGLAPATAGSDLVVGEDGTLLSRPGEGVFRFNVVAVKPDEAGAAAALFVGFASQVSIEFLPPVDAFQVKAESPSHQYMGPPSAAPVEQLPGAAMASPFPMLPPADDPAALLLASSAMVPAHLLPTASSATGTGHQLGSSNRSGGTSGGTDSMADLAREREERRRKVAEAAARRMATGSGSRTGS